MYRAFAVASLLGLAAVAQGQNDIKNIRQRMSDSIVNTQDFLCEQKIEYLRGDRKGGGSPLGSLTLDAGVINARELFAAPANDADAKTLAEILDEMNRAGGSFYAVTSRPVFITNAASYSPAGDDTVGDRKLHKWDFTVPPESSKYMLAGGGKSARAGYYGTFWADDSGDVVKMEVIPNPIPPEVQLKDVVQRFTFARTKVAEKIVLLPIETETHIVDASGTESVVKSKLSACKLYLAKSGPKLMNLAASTTSAPVAPIATSGENMIPARLTLETTLEDPLDERSSQIGSPLHFKVLRDLKQGGKVIAAKGSIITGVLSRMSRQTYKVNNNYRTYFIVGIKLNTIDNAGASLRIAGNLETVGPTTVLTCFLPFSQAPDKWGEFIEVRDEITFPTPEPGESILGVVREYLRVGKGVRMVFTTL